MENKNKSYFKKELDIKDKLVLEYQINKDKKIFKELLIIYDSLIKKETSRLIINFRKHKIEEEIFQEAYLIFAECLNKYNGKNKFSTYFVWLLKKRLIDYIRKDNYNFDQINYKVDLSEIDFKDDKAILKFDKIENDDLIEDLIFILNENEKDVIIKKFGLFGNKKYSYKEIHENMYKDKSYGYSRHIVKKALIKMNKYYLSLERKINGN